jgi:hypothetical protein
VPRLDARSIGKAAQSVKQKRLQSIKSAPKKIFQRRAYEWALVPNRESKASACLGSDRAVRGEVAMSLTQNSELLGYFQQQLAAAYSFQERHSIMTVRDFAYSAVWMVYGSGLMLVGFWKRSAFLRWQAIVLLAMTVLKVFLVDISTLERGYRIAAFIVLGAILLAVSFFYQRSRMKSAA